MKKTDLRVVFVGDSLVNGTSDPELLGWAGRVCKLYMAKHKDVELTYYNIGVRRETSNEIAQRWDFESKFRFLQMDGIEHKAVFSLGVNDAILDLEQSVSIKNLKDMLTIAKQRYSDLVFVMPPPIIGEEINKRTKSLIECFKKVCDELGVAYIDIFDTLAQSEIWNDELKANDNTHPMAKGYEFFAKLVSEDKNWILK